MKYFLIAGEASGDLHAANLMMVLKRLDVNACFCFYGGDRMKAVGGNCLCHYKDIAYMGFIPVLMHLPTILHALKRCKEDILREQPDAVILVDYPGFNLKMAQFVKTHTSIPVFYYILPKVWAWKERRIKAIRSFSDGRLSILPFEEDFFEKKHHCPITYVGNPSVDEVTAYCHQHPADRYEFLNRHGLKDYPIIALLPGSRRQEIKDNLRRMVKAVEPYCKKGYQVVVAGTSDISDEMYADAYERRECVHLLRNCTYDILQHAEAALVTSGTATLEAALFRVPQVVCYYTSFGKLVRWIKPFALKVKYVSLVNLILDLPLVRELIGDEMNVKNLQYELSCILSGGVKREQILEGYETMIQRLGEAGAPQHAASHILGILEQSK